MPVSTLSISARGDECFLVAPRRACTVYARDTLPFNEPHERVVDPLDVHRRGPIGETAEALLERSRAIFLTHEQRIGSRLVVQGVYNLSWESTRQEAAGGWETFGFEEGEQYTPPVTSQASIFKCTSASRSPALPPTPNNPLTWIGSTQSVSPLTQMVGLHAAGDRWNVRAEWAERDPSHCRDCHTIADGSFGPIQTELGNAGINLHSLWRQKPSTEPACAFRNGGCSAPQRNKTTSLQRGMRTCFSNYNPRGPYACGWASGNATQQARRAV